MQTKRERLSYEMTLLPSLETLVPDDHQLRRLDNVLDLHFVHDAVRDKYCADNGRPSIDPEVVIRLFLLPALYGYESVRRLMREVQVNLAYRWFIGYRLDERLPDHSSLSRALDRFGDEVFAELFERSVVQCRDSGLISGRVLHMDVTTIRADLNANRVDKSDSPDGDARFGRFPGGKTKPGYKQQTVADGHKRVVVGLSVKPANKPDDSDMLKVLDDATFRLGTSPEALCADAGYSSGRNCAALEERGVRLISPPPRPITYTDRNNFTVEDFTFDESRDEFTCPSGHRLRYLNTEPKRGRRQYRAKRSVCRSCKLKPRCTSAEQRQLKVSPHHGALIRLRADSKTASFKKHYRSRAPVVEGVFAESKQWHGLARAWRRGLSKMRVQCLLVAAVLNFKRLATLSLPLIVTIWATGTLLMIIRRLWRQIRMQTPDFPWHPQPTR